MKRIALLLVPPLLSLHACRPPAAKPGVAADLLHGEFLYDVAKSPDFAPAPLYLRRGDTLEIHDYFAFRRQPDLSIRVRASGDTLRVEYPAQGGEVQDWTPTVEASLVVRLQAAPDTLYVELPGLPEARPPKGGEAGFRDARQPMVFKVGPPP